MEFLAEKIYGKNNLGISVSKAFLVKTPSSTPKESKFRNVEKCRGFKIANSMSLFQSGYRNRLAETFDTTIGDFESNLSEFNKVNSQIMKFEAGNYLIALQIQTTC
jgi:hypothetical protein